MKKKMYGEIQANLPICNLRPLLHFVSFYCRLAAGRLLRLLSGASVNRLQTNLLGSTLCKASPLPVFLPIVL
jgi:hypothetical protein